MKYIFASIFLLSFYAGCTQKTDNRLSMGIIDSIYSPSLKEYRKLWIYTPEGYKRDHKSRFPVVYLLDGDGHFYSVAGMIQQLSEINGNTICPEMVVVAILNTDRTRDLTPTHVLNGVYGRYETSGGAENFTAFIGKELMPYIESHYPVAPYRTLIGHSFGGLFAINTLINHTDMFNAYIAIDPSLWWDDQKLMKQGETALRENRFKNKSLFFAIANTMNPGMDTMQVAHDTSVRTLHIRSNLLFAKDLDSHAGDGLRERWKYYNDDSHGSVPLIAEYDALHFLFDFYRMPFQGNPDSLTASIVSDHYRSLSVNLGYTTLPPENNINNFGYHFMDEKSFEKAYDFFLLNITNYPKSSNVYDSMGDWYVTEKDNKKAMEYFEKALALENNPDTRKKLEKLKEKH
ncbi:MAG TPA: alpha/beta hydrolase-fold protein [Puia sp.]|nr:alpha/beta hydrolase-fold protein [Puia sp.]